MLLGVGGVRIVVPDNLDAGGCEPRYVEIIARGIAGNIPARAEMFAQIDETLDAVAADVELGGAVARRRNSNLRGQPVDEREIEIDEAGPRPLHDFAQPRQDGVHEHGMGVELADGRQMLAPPIPAIVDLDVENGLCAAPVMQNRDRQPDGAFRPLHAVAVAPTVLVELHVVIVHENVGFAQEIEISEPGQVAWLQDDEGFHETPLRRDRELLRSPAPPGRSCCPILSRRR